MKYVILILTLASCGAVAQQRRLAIEQAEDRFCALRSQEKDAEKSLGLEPDAGTR
jgi:hypothetical protein